MARRDRGGFRNDSSVQLNFVFKRQTGFFLLQVTNLTNLSSNCQIFYDHVHTDLHPTDADCLLLVGLLLAGQD